MRSATSTSPGLGAGTAFAATPTASPDVRMWTFGLHGGARLAMGGSSVITPYLNYDYVNAKLDGFSENGGGGAGLTVGSGKSNHSYLTGGVKWGTGMGGVVPEVNLGYRTRFGDERSSVPRLVHPGSGERLRHRLVGAEEGHVPGWPQRRREGRPG